MNKRVAIVMILTAFFVLTVGATIYAGQVAGLPGISADDADPSWYYEEIDVPGFYFGMGDRSLRVSETGVPHVVYGASHLYLARYQDGAWTSELVDGGLSVGEGASLALDADGHPHIAYKDTLRMKLKYAYWTGQRWQIRSLANIVNWNLLGTAIDLDPAGRPHILYGGDIDGVPGLYYAHWDGTAWTEQMLDSGQVAGLSIAVDETGVPHISYADFGLDLVRYGRCDPGGWHFEDVGPVGYDLGTSLAIDASGEPHIAYLTTDWDEQTDVIYAIRQAGVWTTTTAMTDTENVGLSLVLDDVDQPHIANGQAYLTFDGLDWHEEPVTGLKGSFFESIALNQAGQPIITGLNYGGPFQCAHRDGENWIVDELAYGHTTGRGNVLAMTSEKTLLASYLDQVSDALVYAVRDDAGWQSSVMTTNITYVPNDMIVDAADEPHLCLNDYSRLYYAHRNGSKWAFEQIDADFDGQCALVIDSTGQLHAAYLGRGRVQYAVRDGGVWQTEGLGNYDETVSLAVDSQNRPHLVYFDPSGYPDFDYYLRHAVLTEGGWLTDTIDSDAWTNAAAIAIDPEDGLHVAYFYKKDECELRYAHWDGAQWLIEIVAGNMCQGEMVDLGLDSQGRPHITIWDAYNYLYHAIRTDDGWQLAKIVPGRVYDSDTVVDGSVVYVSFAYEPNRGLLLATSFPLGLDEFVYLPTINRP